MADYSKAKCPRCENMVNVQGVHCMGCALHRDKHAMHMRCPKCTKEWIIVIPKKEEEKK
jgi:hypothetical protein